MVKALKIFKIKMRIWLVWKPSPKLDSSHQNLVKQSHNRASYILENIIWKDQFSMVPSNQILEKLTYYETVSSVMFVPFPMHKNTGSN